LSGFDRIGGAQGSALFGANARQALIMNCRVKPTLASQGATVLRSCALSVLHCQAEPEMQFGAQVREPKKTPKKDLLELAISLAMTWTSLNLPATQ